jgi:excisionase family DNA binding protein
MFDKEGPWMEASRDLTTGQAAELLSVTRDTILKWIKKGRLPALQTAGGHHRVARRDLEPFLAAGAGEQPPQLRQAHCWEYYAEDDEVSTSCTECVVYKAQAARCYELSNLPPELGFVGTHCTISCEDCSYYQVILNKPQKILVVTRCSKLRDRLQQEAEQGTLLRPEFADGGYECSTMLESSRPSCIVIDQALPEAILGELLTHLKRDSRTRSVPFFLAGEDQDPSPPVKVRCIPRRFTLHQLGRIAHRGMMRVDNAISAQAGA